MSRTSKTNETKSDVDVYELRRRVERRLLEKIDESCNEGIDIVSIAAHAYKAFKDAIRE